MLINNALGDGVEKVSGSVFNGTGLTSSSEANGSFKGFTGHR